MQALVDLRIKGIDGDHLVARIARLVQQIVVLAADHAGLDAEVVEHVTGRAIKHAGAYRIAATVSYMEGDPAARCKHFADQLYRVKPEDEMLRNLSVALIHGIEPARTAGADGIAAERERVQAQREQTDAGEGLAAEAMNRVAAR